MGIIFNGKGIDVPLGISLRDFLRIRGIKLNAAIAELNRKVLKTEELISVVLKENDVLEVLSFMGGG